MGIKLVSLAIQASKQVLYKYRIKLPRDFYLLYTALTNITKYTHVNTCDINIFGKI